MQEFRQQIRRWMGSKGTVYVAVLVAIGAALVLGGWWPLIAALAGAYLGSEVRAMGIGRRDRQEE